MIYVNIPEYAWLLGLRCVNSQWQFVVLPAKSQSVVITQSLACGLYASSCMYWGSTGCYYAIGSRIDSGDETYQRKITFYPGNWSSQTNHRLLIIGYLE